METHEARLKRMAMRSWRRGTKEMDLILGPFADAHLAQLDHDALDVYELILEENDQDLYAMITGQQDCPPNLSPLLGEIGLFARARWARG